jgi:hypothetical protein
METGKAIYSILTGASLSGGATVHPEVAPESTDFPFVVYSIQNIQPTNQKDSTSTMDDSTLEVYIMSQNYGQCMTVGAECRTALDRNAGTFNGVEVQSIQFETAEIAYNEAQECYYIEQIYSVRILRVGSAPAATLLPLNASSLQIKETDGTPQAYCTTLKFPAGTLTIDQSGGAGAGIANYAPVWEYSSFSPDPTKLQGGAAALDFSSQTPQQLPFSVSQQTTGTHITANTGGMISSSVDGWHRFTCFINFTSDTHGHSPHFYFLIDTSKQIGEAGAMIPAQHQVDHQPAQLMRVLYLEAGQRVAVMAYDESNKSGSIYVETAYLEVERIA